MKTIYLIIIFTGALCSLAPTLSPNGPAQVAIRGVGQDLSGAQLGTRTNVVGGITNFIQASKSTTTNFTMDAGSLLALLGNSFHTNFPAGCQMLLAGQGPFYSFVVSDTTGTNVGFNPNQVLYTSVLSGSTPLASGVYTEISTNSPGADVIRSQDAESFATVLTFIYDDTVMTNTIDGKHTKFKWVGLVNDKSLETFGLTNAFANEKVTIAVLGSGLIGFPTNVVVSDLPDAVFTGSIQAKLSGSPF